MTPGRDRYFSTFELFLLTEFVAISVVLKIVLRLPMRVPGKSGLFEIALLVLARAIVPRFGAGLFMQTLSGLVLSLLGSGEGILYYTLPRAAARGLAVDLFLLVPFGSWRAAGFAVAGAFAGAAKALTAFTLLALLGPPKEVLVAAMSYGLVTHTVFGAIGGLIGERVLVALEKAGLAAYLRERR